MSRRTIEHVSGGKTQKLFCARAWPRYLRLPTWFTRRFPAYRRCDAIPILMNDAAGTWLLVFKDNSSHACLHAPVDPEDVKGAKTLFDLQRQSAQWYHVLV